MRLHDMERRILATAGIGVVLVVLLFVPGWMWALVSSEDDALPGALVALASLSAAVVLVSVLAGAARRDRGRPR